MNDQDIDVKIKAEPAKLITTKDEGRKIRNHNKPFGFHFLKCPYSPLQNMIRPKLNSPLAGIAEVKFSYPNKRSSEQDKSFFSTPQTKDTSRTESSQASKKALSSGGLRESDWALLMQIVKQEGLKSYSDVWSKRLAGEQPQVYWYKIGFLYEVCKNFKLSNCTLYSAITLMNQLSKATAEHMIECISLSSSLREIMPRLSEELIGDHGSQKDNASISQTKKYLYEKILEKRETVALTFCRNFFVKYFDFTPMQKDKLEHWLDLLFFDQLVAHRNTCELVLSVIQHFIREEKLTHLRDDFNQLLLTIKVSSAGLKSSENVFLYLRNQASVGQANSKCFSSWKDTTAYNLRTEVRRI